jgi:hypothetical protein
MVDAFNPIIMLTYTNGKKIFLLQLTMFWILKLME